MRRAPAPDLLADGAEHPVADLDDQPALLGDRQELGRSDQAADGVSPAHERLDADERAASQRDDRLEVERQLVVRERGRDLVLQAQAPQRALVRGRVGELPGASVAAVRVACGGVGVAQQLRCGSAPVGREREPDRRVEPDVDVLDAQGRACGAGERLGAFDGAGAIVEGVGHDDEPLAREAHERGGGRRERVQPSFELGERVIPRRMAPGQVDAAGVLGVHEQDGEQAAVPACALERALERRLHVRPDALVVRLVRFRRHRRALPGIGSSGRSAQARTCAAGSATSASSSLAERRRSGSPAGRSRRIVSGASGPSSNATRSPASSSTDAQQAAAAISACNCGSPAGVATSAGCGQVIVIGVLS